MDRQELESKLPELVAALVQSVAAEPRMQHLNRVLLPNRDQIIACIAGLRQIVFPGYFGQQGLTPEHLGARLTELALEVSDALFEQVRCCLRYRRQLTSAQPQSSECVECDQEAADVVGKFVSRIPAVRDALSHDVQAAFDGDPAAHSTDETIFCYPGLFAIFVQRMAHEFYNMEIPLLPRIMTEHAHSLTGIDIHPGARLGAAFLSTTARAWSSAKPRRSAKTSRFIRASRWAHCRPRLARSCAVRSGTRPSKTM